jgi:antitoxin ParD1/3/4
MNKHLKVELDDVTARLVERRLESGEYASAEDVIRASMQMMEEESERIAFIRAALEEGEASGSAGEFHIDEFLAEMHAKYHAAK